MNRHRSTILIGLMAGTLAALPTPALATPLLSGYGGPGQGNQAILGSALVNGPRGRGGGGAGGGGDSGSGGAGGEPSTGTAGDETQSSSSASTPTGTSGTPAKHSSSASGRGAGAGAGARRAGGQRGAGKSAAHRSAGAAASAASFYPAAERVPSGVKAGALGLSGEDALLIAVAIGSLALVAGLTRRATRTTAVGRQR